jgi:hypothetical protein
VSVFPQKMTSKDAAKWELIRQKGLRHFLLKRGVIQIGGMYAGALFLCTFYFGAVRFVDYVISAETWFKFFFNAFFFGILMGCFIWYASEVGFTSYIRNPSDKVNG